MRSSSRHLVLAAAAAWLVLSTPCAQAQQKAQGFAVERFSPSAPGSGWFVMDALDLHGGLGGALGMTLGYARNPLRVSDSQQRLAVVSDQAFLAIGAALTYERLRVYLDLHGPLVITGDSGTVAGHDFTAPSVDLGSRPDTFADVRLGADVRIYGRPRGRIRFGAGAQLLVPSGSRGDYDTDGTFRGMVRALFAGDLGRFVYAGHLGVHLRPLDDTPTPESPNGSELLFGIAGGARLPVGKSGRWVAVVGPEIYGATAFQSFLRGAGTALEGLFGARIEGAVERGMQLRARLGLGAGINPHLGAAEWRLVLGIEAFNYDLRKPR